MIRIEHNVETGEIIERQMTAEELAQWEAEKAKVEAEVKKAAEVAAKAAAAKAALLAKLSALGLTADDLKALNLG